MGIAPFEHVTKQVHQPVNRQRNRMRIRRKTLSPSTPRSVLEDSVIGLILGPKPWHGSIGRIDTGFPMRTPGVGIFIVPCGIGTSFRYSRCKLQALEQARCQEIPQRMHCGFIRRDVPGFHADQCFKVVIPLIHGDDQRWIAHVHAHPVDQPAHHASVAVVHTDGWQ